MFINLQEILKSILMMKMMMMMQKVTLKLEILVHEDHNEAQRVLASEDHNLKLQPESDPLRLHEKCLFYILHCMFQKQSLSFVFSLFHV
ncbi:hypothetical protein Bca4012_092750 [Brassica carinata]